MTTVADGSFENRLRTCTVCADPNTPETTVSARVTVQTRRRIVRVWGVKQDPCYAPKGKTRREGATKA
jgi:hypothetical protein